MTPWIYAETAKPVAKWGLANGRPSVLLDMPEDELDESDTAPENLPGSEEWNGETAIFQGDDCAAGEGLEGNAKALAIEWLEAALASVRALPDEPTVSAR